MRVDGQQPGSQAAVDDFVAMLAGAVWADRFGQVELGADRPAGLVDQLERVPHRRADASELRHA
jgi:hypothetical protein